MRHPILIDSDVQAAIWRDRQAGEATLNAMLRRKLGLTGAGNAADTPVVIERVGVGFAEGFAIFRRYKGREYRAQAVEGGWLLLQTGEVFPSLNKLSRGIGTGVENAWNYWRYVDRAGVVQLLMRLRQRS
jgi:hypothetical protein